MQSIIKPVTMINSPYSEDVDINNRGETYHDLTDTVLTGNARNARNARRVTSHLSEADQQATNLHLPHVDFVATSNDIYHNRHNRTVNLEDDQGYQGSSEGNRSSFYQENCNNTKYDIPPKNRSKQSRFSTAIKTASSFFTSLFSTGGKKMGDFNVTFKPKEIVASLVKLCCPCATFILQSVVFLSTVNYSGASDKTNTDPLSDRKTASTNPKNMKDIPKDINNIEMLNKIGRDPDFPANGTYRFTQNLDGSGFKAPMNNFCGVLDGNGYAISGVTCCLTQVLSGHGVIKNLTVIGANIFSADCSSVIAGFMTGNASIKFVTVTDSHVTSPLVEGYGISVDLNNGIITEYMDGYTCIENCKVENCTLTALSTADVTGGCLSGVMDGFPKTTNNTIKGCRINSVANYASIGCVSGVMEGHPKSSSDYVSGCHCTTHGDHTRVGIATSVVYNGVIIKNGTFIDSTATAHGNNSMVAIVPTTYEGVMSDSVNTISDSTADNCTLTANASDSNASVWTLADPKDVMVENCKDINCTVVTTGPGRVTRAKSTTTGATTTTEQAVNAPLLLIGGVVAFAATFIGVIGCVGYSLRNGYKEGKQGRALLMHPLHSCAETLSRFYQRCRGNLLLPREDLENLRRSIEDDFPEDVQTTEV
ncbi:MAG: hypothetical protein KAG53_01520 [Endozoicomonadaceae bacterium]|nr:hypothetical protein [Endozoicomonadaceae bacterium]